jgi:hypothetical protein
LKISYAGEKLVRSPDSLEPQGAVMTDDTLFAAALEKTDPADSGRPTVFGLRRGDEPPMDKSIQSEVLRYNLGIPVLAEGHFP